MVNACRSACSFSHDMDKAAFLDDPKSQSAVLHQLTLLGEACKRLSSEFRSANPDVQWRQIAGLRDRLIHGYDSVDLDLVWETLRTSLPTLMEQLAVILRSPDDELPLGG